MAFSFDLDFFFFSVGVELGGAREGAGAAAKG